MEDEQSRDHSFDPYAPPNPAVADQLREFGLTAREADQFATVLAMASNADRLGLARLLAPSLVTGTATNVALMSPEDVPWALVKAGIDAADHLVIAPLPAVLARHIIAAAFNARQTTTGTTP